MYFNSFSIRNKQSEFSLLLKEHNVHIAFISETFLKSAIKFQIANYKILRKDTDDQHGGGIAILVHKSLQAHQINLPTTTSIPEVLGIKVTSTTSSLVVLGVYIPNSVKEILKSDLNALFRLNERVLIAGDFNSRHHKWLCNNNNRKGKSIFNYLEENKNRIKLHFPLTHTYFPNDQNKSSSTIDLALSKNVYVSEYPKSLKIMSSDHNPVLIQIQIAGKFVFEDKIFYNYKKADWLKYENFLNENVMHNVVINTPEEIDEHIGKLTDLINDAIEVAVPKSKPFANDIPSFILDKIKYKNSVRRHWQKSKQSYLPNLALKTQLNLLSREIEELLFRHRNNNWRNTLNGFRAYDKNMYSLIKRVTTKNQPLQPLIINDEVIYNPQDKANIIAKTFKNIHKQNENMGNPGKTREVRENVNTFAREQINNRNFEPTTPKEILNITKRLKINKAPGFDKITNVALKHLNHKVLILLTKIMNACLKIGYFPEKWKVSKVLPFPKPGKPSNKPENLRPISLLSHISKILEKIILLRLQFEVNEKEILQDEQFGFRSKHSTNHALINIITEITNGLNRKESTSMVLLDVEKAFDTVWIDGLVFKLIKHKISPYLIKIIQNYLSNRKIIVYLDDFCSNEKLVSAGVPQGSLLGPLLFIIYISDMPKNQSTKLSIFADDTSILSTDKSPKQATQNIQNHLNELQDYFTTWKIKINANKTEQITFTKKRNIKDDQLPFQLQYNSEKIEIVRSAKYLGVFLSCNLKFNIHVKHVIQKAKKAMNTLFPFIKYENDFNLENKLLMYKLFLRPILTYSIQAWNNIPKTQFNKLQVIQNKNLRMALDLRPDPITYKQVKTEVVHEMAKVPMLKPFIFNLSKNTHKNMLNHKNNIIAKLSILNNEEHNLYKTPLNMLSAN